MMDSQLSPHGACHACVNPMCCVFLVQATFYEAGLIMLAYPELVDRLADKIRVQSERELAAEGDAEAYWRMQNACVFQDEKGHCTVYDIRPYNCAMFYIYKTENPAECGTIYSSKVEQIKVLSVGPMKKLVRKLIARNSQTMNIPKSTISGLATALRVAAGELNINTREKGRRARLRKKFRR